MAYTTIDDPSEYFQTTIYTGNDTDGTQITNSGNSDLKPDWLWIKNRTDSGSAPATGGIWDSTRGFAQDKVLTSFTNNAEGANANGFAVATTDGFTVEDGTSGANPRTATNKNAKNYVAWQWKANGGTTTTNNDGSTASTVQANTTAGFSIVTYTGTGSNATVGHGLGKKPDIVIIKDRDNAKSWVVFSSSQGAGKGCDLNTSDAFTSRTEFQSTEPTTSVFSLGTDNNVNGSSQNYVAFLLNDVKGYSKFGSYEGNGSTDGAFVYTGFKPAWFLIKCADQSHNWILADNKRDTSNVCDTILVPNNSNAEFTETAFDFVSNGVKVRQSASSYNQSGQTYIYMAFAEHPFVNSKGVPVTAR